MKTVEKLETLLNDHRERVSLALILLVLSVYALGCERRLAEPIAVDSQAMVEVPAEYVATDASVAREVPDWAPENVDAKVRFYYLPTAEVYYDTYVGQYVYYNGVTWVYSVSLPRLHADIDLFTSPVVCLSIGIARPWLYHTHYMEKYAYYKRPGWAKHHHPRYCFDKGWPPAYGARHKFAGGPKPGNGPKYGHSHKGHPYGPVTHGQNGYWKGAPAGKGTGSGMNSYHGDGHGFKRTGSPGRNGFPGASPKRGGDGKFAGPASGKHAGGGSPGGNGGHGSKH